jgi:hypothetical protein
MIRVFYIIWGANARQPSGANFDPLSPLVFTGPKGEPFTSPWHVGEAFNVLSFYFVPRPVYLAPP